MDNRCVLFFDIDNCLYPRSLKIHDMMAKLIDNYFEYHLELDPAEAKILHNTYYTQFGLALEGLVRYHKVNAMDYNKQVDDALPLERVLSYNPRLRALLEDLDTTIVKPWLFTNAYVTHGRRVVRLLGVEDLFEGLTYSDYSAIDRGEKLLSKPAEEAYQRAMTDANVDDVYKCFFVDDSYINCKGADSAGWTAVHFLDESVPDPPAPASQYQIRRLEELRIIFPRFFKSTKPNYRAPQR
ncbi:MAG: hypothetical protein M1814_006353 [Vezdaea aestivalis]|nr:MAG: hypothetical protein M1814_006353 [Vezdaea aestivalis]